MKKAVRMKGLIVVITIIASILLLRYVITKPVSDQISGYLSKSEHVNANLLIVEGWLPDYGIELAYKEFQKNDYKYIITTGLKFPSDYYNVACNGYLIFYLKNRFSGQKESGKHTIEVDAFSEIEGDNCAHFNLYVNDSLMADFNAVKKARKYSINWNGNLKDIDSVMVQFTNDAMGDFGDRNLYVKQIIIDHSTIIPYQKNSIYDIRDSHGNSIIRNNFNSCAELARNRLLSMGMDSSRVISIPGKKALINRTLKSALAFRDWLKTTNIDIKGINIISLGTHTRRTWMIYNKILHEKYPVGIISLQDYSYNHSKIYKLFKTIRETLGIIYYWIVLIPY